MKRGKRLQAVILSVCIVVSLINCPSYYTKAYSEDKFKYDDLVYIMEDDTITIVGYEGDDTEIIIPDEIDGKKVLSIGYEAFKDNKIIEKIDLGNVETIFWSAFSGCVNLKEVNMSMHLKNLWQAAFADCKSLKSILIPKSLEKSSYSLDGVSYDTSCGPFMGCDNLSSITFESGCDKIVGGLFANFDALQEVNLPDEIKSIEDGAFVGCDGLKHITIPENIEYIGIAAFANCKNLQEVYLPNSIKECWNDAFEACNNAKIYANKYSETAKTLVEGNIPFIVMDTPNNKELNTILDYGESDYNINANGYQNVNCIATYQLAENMNVKASYVHIYTNNHDALTCIMLDGTEINEGVEYETEKNSIIIPVNNISGRIEMYFDDSVGDYFVSYAEYLYSITDEYASLRDCERNFLGVIASEVSCLSLNVVKEVSFEEGETEKNVNISGRAAKEEDIQVYVDDVLQMNLKASKAGNYSGTVNLQEIDDGKKYTIKVKAKSSDGEKNLERTAIVKSLKGIPYVTEFNLYVEAHDYEKGYQQFDLLQKKEKINYILLEPSKKYKFSVKYNTRTNIDQVYVTSTRNGSIEKLEAIWNEKENAYVTEGYFADDPCYTPGKINVEYFSNEVEECWKDGKFFTQKQEEQISTLRENLKVEIVERTKNTLKTKVTLPNNEVVEYEQLSGNLNALTVEEYDAWLNSVVGQDTIQQSKKVAQVCSSAREEKSKKERLKDVFKKFKKGELTQKEFSKELAENGFVEQEKENLPKSVLRYYKVKEEHNILTFDVIEISLNQTKDEFNDKLLPDILISHGKTKGIGKFIKTLKGIKALEIIDGLEVLEFLDIEFNYNRRKREINVDSSLTKEEKENELTKLEAEKITNQPIFHVMNFIGSISGTVAGDYIREIGKQIIALALDVCKKLDGLGGKQGAGWKGKGRLGDIDVKWIMDPSGILYEGSLDNRVEGATVTLYYRPSLDSEDISVWNAAEYDQQNPLISDVNGAYAWFVPEGYWQVKAEKEGYETAYSEWLPVPPIQMNVNIEMKRKSSNDSTESSTSDMKENTKETVTIAQTTESVVEDPKNPQNTVVTVGNAQYKITGTAENTAGTVSFVKSTKDKKKLTSLTIPNTVKIDGKTYNVTAIEKNACKNYSKLKKLTIGKNVKSIGASAFAGCKALKSIKIQSTLLTKKTIGKKAFSGIHKKAVIKVPKKKVKEYKKALYGCGVSKTVKIK